MSVVDNLLEKGLSATAFDPDAARRPLPGRARTVVIGAGIVGSSVAHHLAALGERDVVLLERHSVAAGTSWHAAGLVSRGRGTRMLTALADYGMGFYRQLSTVSGIDVGLRQPGSILLARTPERVTELRYADGVARHAGIPSEMITPERVAELHPLASTTRLVGGLHQPDDGHLNPGRAALAIAALAHRGGVTIREGVTVTGIAASAGRIRAVLTTDGEVECETVVLATGLWTRDLAATCGAAVPIWPAAHLHVRTAPVAGAEEPLPVLRDLDGYLYVRTHAGSLLVGAFESNGKPLDPQSLPGSFAFGELAPDWDHFAPIRALAEERVPVLRDSEYVRFLNAPESFTPDTAFCLGETAEVAGLYVAAGFNSQGIIYAPGAGRALAEWIVEGAPTFDAGSVDVQRFSPLQATRRYLHARTVESLGNLYAMHWPHLQPTTARDLRRTPLHDRVDAAGAVFGEMTGYERANWYAIPGQPREYVYSYGRQSWFERAGEEHRAARESVAVFDLSTFSKVEIAGPEALALLQHLCTANVDVAVGRVVYTLMLNARGGIVLDGTITRLTEDRFLVVTPTAAHTRTLALLQRAASGRAVSVVDRTAGLATIAVMGPSSRELLARITDADLSTGALPWGRAAEIEVGRGRALCLRVSFVGELGYELYPTSDLAVALYDDVVVAGVGLGLRAAGYHALDSLRCEKGYRHLGHDIGPTDDPYQASLGSTVRLEKDGGFVGRDAIADRAEERPDRRQVYVRLDDPEPLLHHEETIFRDGEAVGHVTSGAYGHTIGGACGLAYVRGDVAAGSSFTVDCGGRPTSATVSDTPFYDPQNARLKA